MCSVCKMIRPNLTDKQRSQLLGQLGQLKLSSAHQDEVVGKILGMKTPKIGQSEEDEFDTSSRSDER